MLRYRNNFEELPFRESMKRAKYSNRYYKFHSLRYKTQRVYRVIHRVIECNIGKSFDQAFSYFCKIMPREHQAEFLKNFDKDHAYCTIKYFVDDNGLIQKQVLYTCPKKELTITSVDAVYESRHIITGARKPLFFGLGMSYAKRVKEEALYRPVLVAGWEKTFDRKTREYKKLRAEKQQALLKKKKQRKKLLQAKSYQFLTKQERLDKKETIIKLIAKGFDPKRSFRNH